MTLNDLEQKTNWLGYTMRQGDEHIAKQVLKWTPNRQGRGRPRNTWKRDMEKEMEATCFKYIWKKTETAAQDRARLRRVAYVLSRK